MYDLVAMGEILIDFTQVESAENKIDILGSAGGAPGNVLVQGSRLGAKTAYVGAVGKDMFGEFLKKELAKYDIDTKALVMTREATTTLAIVYFDADGDRSFDFVRAPGADTMMTMTKEAEEVLDDAKVILYGSLTFAKDPTKTTILSALEKYRGKKIIAYDPNLRPAIWNDDDTMRDAAKLGMKYADILKLGDDEAMFIMETDSVDAAVEAIKREYGTRIICVTKGKYGCSYYMNGKKGDKPSYSVKTLDTTGAGDSFFGALLWKLGKCDYEPDMAQLGEAVQFANASGAFAATRRGTMDAMGTEAEIRAFMEQF